MNKIILLLSFVVFTGSQIITETGSELKIIKTLGEETFFYPAGPMPMFSHGSMAVLENKKLLLFDSAGQQPLYQIDIEAENITAHGTWGNGPGELLQNAPKIISATDDFIYIYDSFSNYLHQYNHDLKFKKTILLDNQTAGFGIAIMADEESLFYSDYNLNPPGAINEYYFRKYAIDGEHVKENYANILSFDSIPALHPIKYNGTLKFGPVNITDGKIYLANVFGSAILQTDLAGNINFFTEMPEEAGIPEAEPRFVGDTLVGEPETSTFRNLDLVVDENYVYTLYSGASSTYEDISKTMTGGKAEDENLRVGEGKYIRVYKKTDGAYMGEFNLPEWTSAIAVDDYYIYGVVWDDAPHIMV